MKQTAATTTTRRTATPTPMGTSLLSEESDGGMAVAHGQRDVFTNPSINHNQE